LILGVWDGGFQVALWVSEILGEKKKPLGDGFAISAHENFGELLSIISGSHAKLQ
jgi:hypothetical protein